MWVLSGDSACPAAPAGRLSDASQNTPYGYPLVNLMSLITRKKMRIATLAAITALACFMFGCSGKNASQYALHEYAQTGPQGTVKVVQLVEVDGDSEACRQTLAGMKFGHAQSLSDKQPANAVKYGREGCLQVAPNEFAQVLRGEPVEEAFYIARTLELNGSSDAYFDIFYGFDNSRPLEVCEALLAQFSVNNRFTNYQCVAPTLAKEKV